MASPQTTTVSCYYEDLPSGSVVSESTLHHLLVEEQKSTHTVIARQNSLQ